MRLRRPEGEGPELFIIPEPFIIPDIFIIPEPFIIPELFIIPESFIIIMRILPPLIPVWLLLLDLELALEFPPVALELPPVALELPPLAVVVFRCVALPPLPPLAVVVFICVEELLLVRLIGNCIA